MLMQVRLAPVVQCTREDNVESSTHRSLNGATGRRAIGALHRSSDCDLRAGARVGGLAAAGAGAP